jgi:Ni/Co efflux regulator RcnB
MTSILKRLSVLACTAALAAFTGVAVAQHNDSHNDNHNDHHDGRFAGNDHDRFQQRYGGDAHKWAGRKDRPHFETGRAIPRNYRVQPVPRSYWGGPPPPAGYSYGYYDGYVVSYNPTTRIIADVLDLATGH